MKNITLAALFVGILALAGCNDKQTAEETPPPQVLTASAIGHYCGMNVLEHTGPKGQIILASREEPVWFSSARDAVSFTMLPEEPKDIRAIYVSDMAKAQTWENPGEENWIDAKKAFFVVGSRMKGGMGADETVPFSDRDTAQEFAARNGGKVMTFAEIPKDYVLGTSGDMSGSAEEAPGMSGHHSGPPAPTEPKNAHSH